MENQTHELPVDQCHYRISESLLSGENENLNPAPIY